MYEQFYGFRERPFQLTPDPEYMFLTQDHRAGITMLEYSLAQQMPLSLITGDMGCGKTTLIRYMLDNLYKDVTVGLISNTSRSFGRLMQWVALAFGLENVDRDDVTLYHEIAQFLIAEYAAGRNAVLIVDEAQNLELSLLEELRLLSNINSDKHVVLQIVLVGQPELRDMVKASSMRQLAQRIGIDYHLRPLGSEDCRHYALHRLRIAGGKVNLFGRDTLDLVHEATGGVPRLINQLCDAALVYGYAERQATISPQLMLDVIKERVSGGVFPGKIPVLHPAAPQRNDTSRETG
jgi:general secretion pathway protein A